jgi:phosphoribosylanthranilate isomerase
MTRVKICGLTEIDQALAAAEYGADQIGLVFAPGRRQVLPEKAIQIVEALKVQKTHPAIVGVFVNSTAREVHLTSRRFSLEIVQLSGEEPFEYCNEIELPVVKTIHISPSSSGQEIIAKIKEGNRISCDRKLSYLLDSRSKDAFGGTGKLFDWQLAKEVSENYPVIVAGGLSPANVESLLKEFKPWGVDVSSGIETSGKKDILKIRDFIKIVKKFDGRK